MPNYTREEFEKLIKRGNVSVDGREVPNEILGGNLKKYAEQLNTPKQIEMPLTNDDSYIKLNEFREMELSESRSQSNYVLWIRHNRPFYSQLASGFAIPNGGYRSQKTAVTMKKEGAEPGVSDYMILHPARGYSGLIIEFKVKYNQPSEEQKEWLTRLAKNGFYCAVCWSAMDAQKLTCWFYDLPNGLY